MLTFNGCHQGWHKSVNLSMSVIVQSYKYFISVFKGFSFIVSEIRRRFCYLSAKYIVCHLMIHVVQACSIVCACVQQSTGTGSAKQPGRHSW